MIPLWMFLLVSAGLFCIGLFGVLSRRNAIAIIMSVELMLNAANLNIVAFWRYINPDAINGQVFAAFIFVVAAAEAAIGLALVIAMYMKRRTVLVEEANTLKW